MNCVVSCLTNLFVNHYPKVFISQSVFWVVSTLIKNPTLVDVAWGANHFLIGYSLFSKVPKSELIFAHYLGMGLLALWFLRLSGFLFYNRIYKRHVDPRYEDLAKNKHKTLYYFFQFHLQGILCMFTAIPLYYVFHNNNLKIYNLLGVFLALAGIIGEAVADQQLQNYKNERTDSSQVFRGGLFKNSRHPNLFFELVTWFGIALLGLNHSNLCSLLALMGPSLLYGIMYYLTIPITTKHMMKSKPNYKEVIEETYVFWPFSQKK